MGETEGVDPYIVTAGQAAKRLGVSASGIRRLLVIYEEVHGNLPRNPDTNARVISSEVVERLGAARRLVEAERFTSIKEALQALEQGLKPDITIADTLDTAARDLSGEALGLLLDEMRAMRSELAELHKLQADQNDMQSLRDEVAALRSELAAARALPPGANPERIDRALEVEMMESRVGAETPGEAERAADGPVVRVAKWFEKALRRT